MIDLNMIYFFCGFILGAAALVILSIKIEVRIEKAYLEYLIHNIEDDKLIEDKEKIIQTIIKNSGYTNEQD